MTAKKFFGLVVIACLISVLVSAEVKNEKQVEPARRAAGATASRQRKVSPDREKAYQEMLVKRMTPNKQTITDLEEVKKIAEEEGAVRTIEAIQKMIEKKQAEVKELTDRFDRQRR